MRVEPVTLPVEVSRDELVRLLNEALDRQRTAINSNDARAIIVEGSSSADLPDAAAELRGRLALLALPDGAAADDELYVCRKNAADAYEWVLIV